MSFDTSEMIPISLSDCTKLFTKYVNSVHNTTTIGKRNTSNNLAFSSWLRDTLLFYENLTSAVKIGN